MPCREVSGLDDRHEFVHVARDESTNRRELCRRFGISATTGYKRLNRFSGDASSLAEKALNTVETADIMFDPETDVDVLRDAGLTNVAPFDAAFTLGGRVGYAP